ncbi:MAG TPA: cytochrome c [Phycisphaerales bacterium]|nr:cytochrome c [Phycisphaerales bacterium]
MQHPRKASRSILSARRRAGIRREILAAGALAGVAGLMVIYGVSERPARPGVVERAPASAAGPHAPSAAGATTLTTTGATGATISAANSFPEQYGVTDEEWAEYVANGTKLYGTTCVACHGVGGAGISGLGKALANSAFVQGQDDDTLLAFIQKGRDPSDPANTTGIGMPAKGGNPALSEDDILDVIAYLRTLQGS